MKTICKADDCFGCLSCLNVCPKDCISVSTDTNGFIRPIIDESKCIGCNRCVKVCPANHPLPLNIPKNVYAGQMLNKEAAMNSTSGGLFQALALYFLSIGGVVCAARQELDTSLHHVMVHNEDELRRCLKSKYYQSSVGSSYREIRDLLRNDIKVLFCGTPCQVAGLLSYLGKNTSGLLTCDLVCHGTPSKKVVDRYIADKEKIYHSKLKEIQFRDKEHGWAAMRMSMKFDNGNRYSETAGNDAFYFGFFHGLYYRKSCYTCPFAKEERIGDITLGDFWGIEQTKSELDLQKGISLIIVNTEKGKDLLSKIDDSVILEPHTMEEAKRKNHNLNGPSRRNPNYDRFYSLLDGHSLHYSLFMSLPLRYIKFRLKHILRK